MTPGCARGIPCPGSARIFWRFLGAITRNLSLDCYRRKHSEKRGGGVMPDIYEELHDCAGGEEPLTQIERKELAASINRFLEG